MNLGKNILAIRKRNGLSLQELAERTGVSRSMLSKIEREEKNPTVQIACQIAEGLELTLSQLLGEQSEKEVVVIPKAKRVIYHDEVSGFERHLLSPVFPSKGMELVLNKIPPHSSSGVFPKHKQGVKEYITVITGNLTANLSDKSFFLSEGDSIYFEADLEHEFKNEHDVFCEYILVIDSYGIK